MTNEVKRRLVDNGDSLLSLITEIMPRLTKKQQERAEFLINTILGRPNSSLFPVDIPTDKRLVIFAESKAANIEFFRSQFPSDRYPGIDIDYYYEAVQDWSNKQPKTKRHVAGWISTARTFMRLDQKNRKLRMIQGQGERAAIENQELEYLQRGYGK